MPVLAQVTADGTTSTTVTSPDGDNFTIDDGDRAGGNLFHSFQDFSVPTNGSAFFNNVDAIENIFSRVTGGNISSIDGLIRANGSANLFLINPAGIIFGRNARLDLGGSFLGSTANSILFPEGEFLATDTETPPLLTINAPIGLGIRDNPGDIVNQSVSNNGNGLEVATGETITLLGGNVDLDGGRIFAPGGRVELGGLSTAGEIGIDADGSLSFPEGIERADVTFTNQGAVNVLAGGGGFVNVNAGNLTLSEQSELLAGIAENLGSPEAQAGDITLNATGAINISQGSQVFNQINQNARGNGGKINLQAGSLSLTEGSSLNASTFGQGDAGRISIQTNGAVDLSGSDTSIVNNVERGGEGDAQGIFIEAESFSLTDDAQILTIVRPASEDNPAGRGDSGDIVIDVAGDVNIFGDGGPDIFSFNSGQGDTGNIAIEADGAINLFGGFIAMRQE